MTDLRSLTGDRDLRRRLMARVGRPLTASSDAPGEMSGAESVALTALDSLISGVYDAASSGAAAEPFPHGPDGRSR